MWPTMNATYPQEEDETTREGVAAHWVLFEQELKAGVEVREDSVAPNNVVVDEEMLEGVDVALRAIEPVQHQELHVERTLVNKAIHDSQNWGTPDLWTFAFPFLDVYDFKYGHLYVDEYENWQLINYVGLILQELGVNGAQDQTITVRMHVIQPRAYSARGSVRTWTMKASDLRGHINILRNAAEDALVNPIARTGPHCEFCPGRHACQMLQVSAQSAIERSGQVMPMELPPQAVGIELRMLKRAFKKLEARITGMEAQALGLIKSGVRVPHFMAESEPGRERWTRPPEEIAEMGKLFSVDLQKRAVVTPNQARKMGVLADVVDAYAERPHSAVRLKLDDGSKAAKVFGK